MFEYIVGVYNTMVANQVNDPFLETIRLFDILSKRTLGKIRLMPPGQREIDISEMAIQRKKGVPFEYILGMAPFLGNFLYCSPDTLIPREETELLAMIAIDYVQKKQVEKDELMLIDMGTGCGNLAVSIALNTKGTKIFASDLKPETIAIAQKNVDQFNLKERISLFTGDLFYAFKSLPIDDKIDIIVCNPPYIPSGSLAKMPQEIIHHEPREAFDAGPFGIDIYRRLINDSLRYLIIGGILLFEIGMGQEKLVTKLFQKKENYSHIKYFDDGKNIRVISAIRVS